MSTFVYLFVFFSIQPSNECCVIINTGDNSDWCWRIVIILGLTVWVFPKGRRLSSRNKGSAREAGWLQHGNICSVWIPSSNAPFKPGKTAATHAERSEVVKKYTSMVDVEFLKWSFLRGIIMECVCETTLSRLFSLWIKWTPTRRRKKWSMNTTL